MKRDQWLYGLALVSGILVWIVVASISGKGEAWDSETYFTVGIPVLCLVAGALAYVEPERAWRWGLIPQIGQGVSMLASQEIGNLFPLGLVALGIFAIPAVVTAKLAAVLSQR
ncbi:membrane protein of unknown function [Nitrospira sp. KM1]|uniref:hypothetical protein n=1 Tax=Nitrospira sp. KM1 TaxID=1936990 RepID=UPI0013A7B1C4|nr:hypothetical protein [Nitrospira sp. KM1]BCA52958.1 membrane protein of unknown function [Nitrospira sp. KM1]